eukprot:TRINITY_DN1602_c0_g1_i1.p1 TRINITY_DN1602_c0_g1~~TRINITY_DN1602_c0_g1_i1.p1  ORF type:complete len:285 (+),score=52.72 TRINITY_DN1602_c0_g1_i1:38-892(+)
MSIFTDYQIDNLKIFVSNSVAMNIQSRTAVVFDPISKNCQIIDPGPKYTYEIEQLIYEYDMKPQTILLTHAHFDHMGSIHDLCNDFPELQVIHHPYDSVLYNSASYQFVYFGIDIFSKYFNYLGIILMLFGIWRNIPILRFVAFVIMMIVLFLAAFSMKIAKTYVKLRNRYFELPEALFFNPEVFADRFSFGNQDMIILYTPGHSMGGVCFFYPGKEMSIIFTGDTIMSRGPGRHDLPGGDKMTLQNSLSKLNRFFGAVPNLLVCPGHGPCFNPDNVFAQKQNQ